ncbi:hypothetical protein [uncultured Nonlabens sp.]|uniref:hypothetical protein n=1 Tax=uncultured Nonlabens sp. TaxID=859306 RepID=UPI00260BE6EF|nr:hypothetical protein [uncultured Nonlabens sp.]
MTTIKILIKADGFVGNNYNVKEATHEKFIKKDLNGILLTEEDCKLILKALITSIEEIKALYPDEKASVRHHHIVKYHNNTRLKSFTFEIVFEDKSGSSHTINEYNFFNKAAKHTDLSTLILKYCDITDDGAEGTRIWIMDEYDQGPPAGTYAILALVNQSKKWIPPYIEFLRTNDLDHEVEQMWDIKSIIDKYGWIKETCRLAIARNISCCGQGGTEQFNDFLNNGLSGYLNIDKNRKGFLDFILQEFEEWDAVDFRLKEGSEKYYKSYIVNTVSNFDKILDEEEINKIKTVLLKKWEDYNRN